MQTKKTTHVNYLEFFFDLIVACNKSYGLVKTLMSWCYLFDFELYAKISDELFLIVVSSKISGVLFAHFRTVEPISKRSAFYL